MRSRASHQAPLRSGSLRLWAPVLGLGVALVALAFWPGLEQPGKAPREALLLVLAPLALGLSAREARSRPPTLFLCLVGVVLLGGALATLWAPAAQLWPTARDLAGLVALGMLAVAASWTPPAPDDVGLDAWIERGVLLALAPMGAIGLAQAWWGWTGLAQAQPPAATFVNRNDAAHALVALIPLALPQLVAGRRAGVRWLAGAAGGLGVAFLIATRSRGGWLGALVGWGLGSALWLASRRRAREGSRRPAAPAPIALFFALGLIALVVPVHGLERPLPSVAGTIGTLGRPTEGSGGVRLALWRNTLAMLEDQPWLGVGPGRFAVEYPRYQAARSETPGFGTERQPESSENDPLEFAAELGLPATAALLVLLLGGVVRSFRQCSRADLTLDGARSAARAAALGGVLVHSLFSFPLHSPATASLVWVLVGRAWSGHSAGTGGVVVRRAVLWLSLAAVPLAAWVGLREVRAQEALGRALRASAAADCGAALHEARRTSLLAPWRRRETGIAAMVHFECDKEPERSLAVLEPALEMHPNQLNLLLAVGARRIKAGRPADAEAAFLRAVEIAPSLGRGWLGLAMARDARQDHVAAQQACREAVRVDPRLEPARLFCEGNGYLRPGS